jgi:hypothetical protein
VSSVEKSIDVSEEHVSFFRAEEYAKQETNKKQVASKGSIFN